jgi:hypothetical protein
MNEIIKESIISDYCWMPSIKNVMKQAKELGNVLKKNERKISLRHCLKQKYIIESDGKYSITNKGNNALNIIEKYIGTYLEDK